MTYRFYWYSDEHGSVHLVSDDKDIGLAATFMNKEEMMSIIEELCLSSSSITLLFVSSYL